MLSSKLNLPDRPQTLAQLILKTCAAHPTKTAFRTRVASGWGEITYRLWETRAARLAAWMLDRGLKPGDRIAILSFNGPGWATVDLAAHLIGVTVVPMYPSLTGPQHNYILADAAIKVLFVMDRAHLEPIRRLEGALDGITVVGMLPPSEWPKASREKLREVNAKSLPQEWPEDVLLLSDLYAAPDPVDAKQVELLRLVKEGSDEALATICYTSGTTATPPAADGRRVYAGKGVMLTHKNLVSNVFATVEAAKIETDDVFLSVLPLAHMFERTCGYYCAVHRGASIGFATSPASFIDDMKEIRPTVLACVPLLFEKMYQRAYSASDSSPLKQVFGAARTVLGWPLGEERAVRLVDRAKARILGRVLQRKTGGRLRFAVSGGAALSRDLAEFFLKRAKILVLEGYGLSETSPVLAFNRPDDFEFGTVGAPAPGAEVKIADDGEVIARGPMIMKGYLNSPEETEKAIDKDGWFHTGDLGKFENGKLKITGRKKCMFKLTTGKYVNPEPIENRLVHELVAQSMVCGEGQKTAGAVIFPNLPALRSLGQTLGVSGDDAALCANEKVRAVYQRLVSEACAHLPDYEKVHQFALVPAVLSVDGGELTPTLKVKRGVVCERFKADIDKMFAK